VGRCGLIASGLG